MRPFGYSYKTYQKFSKVWKMLMSCSIKINEIYKSERLQHYIVKSVLPYS